MNPSGVGKLRKRKLSDADESRPGPAGAAQVQEFHRELFQSSLDLLRQEIKRITGAEVREATAEIEPTTGALVKAFTTGTVVQVFLLDCSVASGVWSGSGKDEHS